VEAEQTCRSATRFRPTTAVSGGPGRRRWEFMRLPDESIAELNTAETAWRLLAPWNLTPDNATLERHTCTRSRPAGPTAGARDGVLIAGDAAHLMPPFAGQGMCWASGTRPTSPGSSNWSCPDNPTTHCSTPMAASAPRTSATRSRCPSNSGNVICLSDPAARRGPRPGPPQGRRRPGPRAAAHAARRPGRRRAAHRRGRHPDRRGGPTHAAGHGHRLAGANRPPRPDHGRAVRDRHGRRPEEVLNPELRALIARLGACVVRFTPPDAEPVAATPAPAGPVHTVVDIEDFHLAHLRGHRPRGRRHTPRPLPVRRRGVPRPRYPTLLMELASRLHLRDTHRADPSAPRQEPASSPV